MWVFDHSSCHAATADDALDVNKMNVRPGGKQRIMRDTTWNGRVWKLYYTDMDEKKVAESAGGAWGVDGWEECRTDEENSWQTL